MPHRFALLALVTGIALALATTAGSRPADIDACSLISTGQIASILGFQHVQILKNIPGTSAHDNTAGVTHSVCNGVAWSGIVSTTPSGVRAALASGSGAAFGIDTWAPDDASAYVEKWKNKGFNRFVIAMAVAATALSQSALPGFAKPFHPHPLLPVGGNSDTDAAWGVTATSRNDSRIRATEGTWWAFGSKAAVSVGFEGSARKPTIEQLNRLARIAVAAFGLKPLQLR